MSSGPQDSANTLYYNNVHYNNTTQPIPSYHKSDLRATFINNGGNYQISINKLKISSLDGVNIGFIPYDTWQIGLEVPNNTSNTGGTIQKFGYVSLTGEQGQGEYDEYYSFLQQTGNITLYKSNGVLPPSQLTTFQPLNNLSNIIRARNSFYDYNKNKFWVVAVEGVFLYDYSGQYLSTLSYNNIVNSNYNVENGVLIICDSDYTNNIFSIVLITETDNILSQETITTNHTGDPLQALQCADTDGTIIIAGYSNDKITTYNYSDRSSITDYTIPNTTKITNILVDSANNTFTYINNEYTPYLMVSNDTGAGRSNPNWIDVQTGTERIYATNYLSSVNLLDQYQFSSRQQIPPPGGETPLSTYLALGTPYNELSVSTVFNHFNNNSAPYFSVAIANNNTDAILMGIEYVANTDLRVLTNGADANWTFEYSIPSNGLYSNASVNITREPQIIQDPFSKCVYVSFGEQGAITNNFKILKSVGPVSIQNTRPCFTYTGQWVIISTNKNIDSMVIDQNYNNVFWGLYNNVIYKGFLVNGFINFEEWYKNLTPGENWKYYITMPFLSDNYNPVQIINQNKLSDFSNINSINSVENVSGYTYIQQAVRKNLLYVVNNNQVLQYDYKTLNFIKNISGIQLVNSVMGQTTSYYIPPSVSNNTVYNMDQYIQAFNNTFQAVYNLLNAGEIQAKTAPSISCDYITKFARLNYDPNWSSLNYGVYVNPALYKYLKFSAILINDNTSPFNGMYKYTLNQTGNLQQNQYTLYQLNQLDKVLVLTNLNILGDFSGTTQQTRIFTDLDLDTQDSFFTGSGNVIYEPQLLRKYDIVSNTQIYSIEYEFKIQYKNGTIVPYYIPSGENISIKLEFDRIY